MSTNWQAIRTASEADDKARETVRATAAGRKWWDQPTVHASVALDVASSSAEDAAEYWSVLRVAWDEAGKAMPMVPPGWDSLAGVWASAAETTGIALAAQEEASLRSIVSGALAGSIEDASKLGETSASAFTGVVEAVKAHPVLAGGVLLSAAILWRSAPEIIGALVSRVGR